MQWVPLAVVALLLASGTAHAAGMRTHVEMCARALSDHLEQAAEMLPGLETLFAEEEARRALYHGSWFPDWGYDGIHQHAAEDSHWEGFQRAYFERMRARLAWPWTPEARRELAFFLGMVSHGVTDIPWHFGPHSFLAAAKREDGASHGTCEVAVDLFTHVERPLALRMGPEVTWPIDRILEVYAARGAKVTREQLERGARRHNMVWHTAALLGRVPYGLAKARNPWTQANYQRWWHGGVDHGAAVTAMAIRYWYARARGWRLYQNAPRYARGGGALSYAGCREERAGKAPQYLELYYDRPSVRLRFELTDLPRGTRIASARLWLYLDEVETKLYRASEIALRWNSRDVTAQVREWVARPEANQGALFTLSPRDRSSNDFLYFFSSEAGKNRESGLCGGVELSRRPILVVVPENAKP